MMHALLLLAVVVLGWRLRRAEAKVDVMWAVLKPEIDKEKS